MRFLAMVAALAILSGAVVAAVGPFFYVAAACYLAGRLMSAYEARQAAQAAPWTAPRHQRRARRFAGSLGAQRRRRG